MKKRDSKARGCGEGTLSQPSMVEETDMLKEFCWRIYSLLSFDLNVKYCFKLVRFLHVFVFHQMHAGCEFGSWFIEYSL